MAHLFVAIEMPATEREGRDQRAGCAIFVKEIGGDLTLPEEAPEVPTRRSNVLFQGDGYL